MKTEPIYTLGMIRAAAEAVGVRVVTTVTPARRGRPERTSTEFFWDHARHPVVGWVTPSARPLRARHGKHRAGTLSDLARHLSHIPGFTGRLKREAVR